MENVGGGTNEKKRGWKETQEPGLEGSHVQGDERIPEGTALRFLTRAMGG